MLMKSELSMAVYIYIYISKMINLNIKNHMLMLEIDETNFIYYKIELHDIHLLDWYMGDLI